MPRPAIFQRRTWRAPDPRSANRDAPPRQGSDARHAVAIEPDSLLAASVGTTQADANSSHHQAADPAALGEGLRIVARSEDGTVEALEWRASDRPWMLAVQWHPERMPADDPLGGGLFERFVETAAPGRGGSRERNGAPSPQNS
ncbi:MAG: gamma-glutamyl-gamma-aminobutyrate hydrolase family protein [Vulcanimicrobiaceae bacterium]